jgi:hypothetical protein
MTQSLKLIKLTSSEKKQVCSSIHNIKELSSAGVRFVESGEIDNFINPSNLSPKIWVIIKREATQQNALNNVNKELRDLEERPKKIVDSIISAAFSCGSAVLAGVAAVGSGAAAIPSFGASTPIAVITWAGTVAGAAKCGTDLGRALNENLDNDWFNPKNNEILDENKAFKFAENALEITENAAGIAKHLAIGKKLIELSNLKKKSISSIFKGDFLSKSEKKEIAKYLYMTDAKSKTSAKNAFNSMVKSGIKIDSILMKEFGEKVSGAVTEAVEYALKKIVQSSASTVMVYISKEE